MPSVQPALDFSGNATVSTVRPVTPPPVVVTTRLQLAVPVTPTKPKEFVKMRDNLLALEKGSMEYAAVRDKSQEGSVSMALKAGTIEKEWTRWRNYNK
ncbi:hypothetical protein QFC21_006941 [Naganishia friedmannii]|uniref:Uncharacterized protein n=1 Tax=Naganishia friedmannii TaxID=89922 RepID=A0ACC2UZA7_9TREE|nr:hypothetical protein QFC21_006941 [Naganishia friedmannii]